MTTIYLKDQSANPVHLMLPNVQTSNYTLVRTDNGRVIEVNSASAVTVTVPPNSSVAFEIGSVVNVYAASTGVVTIAAGAGVTIRTPTGQFVVADEYGEVSLRKRGTDEWVLAGDI